MINNCKLPLFVRLHVEALLRTYIQKMNNCRFIFAGSDRHTLENMFNSPAMPFYNSVEQMYLDCIDRPIYISFMRTCFEEFCRSVPDVSVCECLYNLFEGHTYYVHQTLHNIYAYCDRETAVTESLINAAVDDIVQGKEHSFLAQMSLLNFTPKETLIAIAKEKEAAELTSVAFVRRHSLQSPSAVQNAIRILLNLQMIIYRQNGRTKVYSISDRFLQMWIVGRY